MPLDLNDPNQFTLAGVSALIASKDDSQNRQLRVTKNGIAYLSDEVGNENIDGLAFRLETWDAGNDYCGVDAAASPDWVKNVYNMLRKNWPDPKSTYIDS